MTILGQKQLRLCASSERAATFGEDGTHEILEETTTVFAEFFHGRSCCLFSRGTIGDKSPPGNGLPQWLLSTNDLGASTFPTYQLLANHKSLLRLIFLSTQ